MMAADTGQSASHSIPADSYNLDPNKIALKGYDPVSYFAQGAPARGKKEISAIHNGVTYYFASEEDKKAFAASPAKYLPAYGGWCATAMAKGEKVQVDPNNFKVTNGRLFLFYKGLFGNALNDWNKDEAALTVKADDHWKTIGGE
jgi:YHS domain-containing protein